VDGPCDVFRSNSSSDFTKATSRVTPTCTISRHRCVVNRSTRRRKACMRTWALRSPCFRCASTYRRPDPVVGAQRRGTSLTSSLIRHRPPRSASGPIRSLAPGRTAGTIRGNAWLPSLECVVSISGFHEWRDRGPLTRDLADAHLSTAAPSSQAATVFQLDRYGSVCDRLGCSADPGAFFPRTWVLRSGAPPPIPLGVDTRLSALRPHRLLQASRAPLSGRWRPQPR
jgi:hypothetical protein